MALTERRNLTKDKNASTYSYGTEDFDKRNSGSELLPKMTKYQLECERVPYPKSVFFIVVNEFCERFSYYGMKAVLTLYLRDVLLYSDNSATVIYHVFSMFCYFTCIFGAIISDSWLGKFKTIFYLSIVYAAGNVLLSLAATEPIGLPPNEFSMMGLALIAIGTGGIKPCVAAFGGDQFKLPQQEQQLTTFFSVFYFSINAGSLISTFITPIFRENVHCFGQESCYPLAFACPSVLMILALVIFVCGKPFYIIKPSEGNVVMKVTRCIAHALSRKSTSTKREHWLDNADDKYPRELIEDIKCVLRVLFLYIPLPIFWALFDQQGSRWTIMATRMNGDTFLGTIKPDQMQVVNPFLILALIPLFDQIVYPLLGKCGILKKPLQRLTVGGLLAAVAFIVSGLLELKLETTYAIKLEPTEINLNFVNSLPCSVNLTVPGVVEGQNIATLENSIFAQIKASTYIISVNPDTTNPSCLSVKPLKYDLTPPPGYASTYVIGLGIDPFNSKTINIFNPGSPDDLEKSKHKGYPRLRIIHTGVIEATPWNEESNSSVLLTNLGAGKSYDKSLDSNSTFTDIEVGEYDVILKSGLDNNTKVDLGRIHLKLGGVYVLTVTKNFSMENVFTGKGSYNAKTYILTAPNSVHMLFLLIQYTIITVAEVMFSITGLEFSYSQAPTSMKSVVQSAWLLTVAFGNLVVVVIAEAHIFEEQWKEFFLFAGLMIADIILFAILAYRYKPSTPPGAEETKATNNNEMTAVQGTRNIGYQEE